MASTLFTPSMTTSNTFQMPKVFIIPPEEDQSPSWCYFDAAKRGLNRQVDSALFPVGSNNTTALKDGSCDNIVLGALDHHASLCVENDIDYDCEAELLFEEGWDFSDQSFQESHVPQCALLCGYEEPGNDSDVTEVIKIGRHGHGQEESAYTGQSGRSTRVTRSQTLKSRASRVFHSLKKVGRRKSFKLSPAQDNIRAPQADTASLLEISHSGPPQTLTLHGRSSILTSQLFTPPTGLKSRPSFSRAEEHVNSSLSHSNPSSAISEGLKGRTSFSSQDSGLGDRPTFAPRAASPSPSFLNKRHFSRINIQRLFSLTTSISTASSTISGGLTLSSNDDVVRTSPLPSSCSNQEQGADSAEGVDRTICPFRDTAADSLVMGRTDSTTMTDVEHKQHNVLNSFATELSLNLCPDLNLELGLELGLPSTAYKVNDASSRWDERRGHERRSLDDINFGMHLDSLHFDELSFDVNDF